MKHLLLVLLALALLPAFGLKASDLFAQNSAFTYQGQLREAGAPANGVYDLSFALMDAAAGGSSAGGPALVEDVVVSGGLFTVTLDFGPGAFTGADRWLEIGVRADPGDPFSILSPRQPITATPYAIRAANAAAAAALTGTVAASQLTGAISPDNLAPGTITSAMLADGAVGTNQLAAGTVFTGSFLGDGSGVTNVDVASLRVHWSEIFAWGSNFVGQTIIPRDLTDATDIVAGDTHSVALKSDGTVVAWGDNSYGQLNVPEGLDNVVAISAGGRHTLALRNDGTVVSWGSMTQSTVPLGLNQVAAIAAGDSHNLAVKTDGTVTAWGDDSEGQATVPAGLNDVVAAAGGRWHSLALKSDGTVVVWGSNDREQLNIPAGLSGVVEVAAGYTHSLALKSDGTVISWGQHYWFGFTDSFIMDVPEGLSDVVAISARWSQSVALRSDGTVEVWGHGPRTTPAGLSDATAVALGAYHALALRQPRREPVVTGLRLNDAILSASDVALRSVNNTFSGSITANGGFAGSGSLLTGLNATNLTTGTINDARLSANVALRSVNNTFSGSITASSFSGSGSSLTGLNATNLTTGTISDARLSSNVALRSVNNTFSGSVTANGGFAGSGSLLTGLNATNLTNGTINDARLSGNVALRGGGNSFSGNQSITNGRLGIGTSSPARMVQLGGHAGTEGMIRLSSVSATGVAARTWEIGVPKDDADVSGKFYSFVIDDVGVGEDPEFIVRWGTGDVGIGVVDPQSKLHVNGAVRGTSFVTTSDRGAKENFQSVSPAEILAKVAALPIQQWNFKSDTGASHIGPMAQDFYAAFGVGPDDKHIATVDADGVAFAAIQGLNQKLEETRAENADLKKRLERLENLLHERTGDVRR
jgi:hypothetical protein